MCLLDMLFLPAKADVPLAQSLPQSRLVEWTRSSGKVAVTWCGCPTALWNSVLWQALATGLMFLFLFNPSHPSKVPPIPRIRTGLCNWSTGPCPLLPLAHSPCLSHPGLLSTP